MNIDRLSRRIVAAIGALAILLGIATMIVVEPLVDVLPSTSFPILFAGMVAFAIGLWGIRSRYHGESERSVVSDVEYPLPTPAPGSDVDDALYRLTTLREGTTEIRDSLQERMGELGVDLIQQRENCSREEAIAQLQEGTWTDDPIAAGFYAGGNSPSLSLSERIFGSGETVYERWIDQTLDALEEYADLPRTESGEDEDSGRLGLGSSGSRGSVSVGYQMRSQGEESEEVASGVRYAKLLSTGQWAGIGAFSFVAVGVGLIGFSPEVLLLSVVGVGLAAYSRAATEPDLRHLDVERRYSETDPDPGEIIEVTVQVTNEGGSWLPDLRLIDQVPGAMRVVDGSPRLGTALGSGDTATFSYEVVVERGVHDWPIVVVGRDVSGSVEREATIDVDDEFRCMPSLATPNEMPVRSQTSLYSGQVDTDIGGAGLEFHSVREYRQGDPMKRIDWKRHARTGELATIDFRLERAANVVLLFDARDSAFVSPDPTEHHALDRSVQAAAEVFGALFERGDMVGVAAFDTVPCWLAPGADEGHRERARRLFATHPALSSTPPQLLDHEGHYVDPMTHVRRQMSAESQVVMFSPLCDDYTAEVAVQLNAAGHPVTIISPDPTATRTAGQRLARIERQARVNDLRERGIRVIDWEYGEMLGLSLDHAKERWAV